MKAAQVILALLAEDLKLPIEKRMSHAERQAYLDRLPKRKKQKNPYKGLRKKKGPQSLESRLYTAPDERANPSKRYLSDDDIARIRSKHQEPVKAPTKAEVQAAEEESKKSKFLESLGAPDENPVAGN